MNKNATHEIKFDGSKTIIVTKKFLKAASVMGTPEHNEAKKLLQDHPGFIFVERTIEPSKKEKNTYAGLTVAKAKDFLTWHYSNNEDGLRKATAELDELMDHCEKYHKNGKSGCLKSWIVRDYKAQYIEWDKRHRKIEAKNDNEPDISIDGLININ